MDKLYFEMSETERQLELISNNLNYAICVFAERLTGFKNGMDDNEADSLQDQICDLLIKTNEKIEILLKNVNL